MEQSEDIAQVRRAIGHRIKIRRAVLDITQAELAARVGSEQVYVSRWERGSLGLRVEQLIAIAQALETSVGYLVGEVPDARV